MSHIFISYSKADIDFARRLRRLLEREGFAVWMDEARLVPSSRWWPEIEHNIDSCDAFLVIMSPSGKDSDWVEREILHAERLRKPVFPVLLSGEVWSRLANIQYTDMRDALSATLPQGMVQSLHGVVTPGQAPPQLPREAPRSSIPDQGHTPADSLPAPRDLTPPPTPRTRRWRDRLVRGVIRAGIIAALVIVAIFALEVLLGGNATVNDHDGSAENGAPPHDENGSVAELPEDELRSILIEQLHSPDRDAVQEAIHRLDEAGWLFDGSLAGIDLSHVDLSGMDLNGAQLPGANFSEATLQEARFQEANLTEARFERTIFVGTVMTGANLEGARIIHADARAIQLAGANLSGAQMIFTNFEDGNLNEADLRGANLEQSNIRWTVIDGTRFNTETVLPDGRPWQPGTDMGRYLLLEHPDFWRSDDPNSPAHF